MDEKAIARFWKYVERSDGCWLWIGARTERYGMFWNGTKYEGAHRSSFRIHKGDPGGAFVCHTCDNGFCVRPDHLWLGDVRANTRDMVAKDRAPLTNLTNAAVAELRRRARDGATLSELTSNVGLHYNVVRAAVRQGWLDCGEPPVPVTRKQHPPLRAITEDQVRAIRSMKASGERNILIAKRLGLAYWHVQNVLHGKAGRNVA